MLYQDLPFFSSADFPYVTLYTDPSHFAGRSSNRNCVSLDIKSFFLRLDIHAIFLLTLKYTAVIELSLSSRP